MRSSVPWRRSILRDGRRHSYGLQEEGRPIASYCLIIGRRCHRAHGCMGDGRTALEIPSGPKPGWPGWPLSPTPPPVGQHIQWVPFPDVPDITLRLFLPDQRGTV